jgi:hypothetical protein
MWDVYWSLVCAILSSSAVDAEPRKLLAIWPEESQSYPKSTLMERNRICLIGVGIKILRVPDERNPSLVTDSAFRSTRHLVLDWRLPLDVGK